MEGTMEQFTEKLAGLVELGKKNKNFLEYAQIDSYFKDMKLNSDMMEAIYDYLEQNGIDVLTLPQLQTMMKILMIQSKMKQKLLFLMVSASKIQSVCI